MQWLHFLKDGISCFMKSTWQAVPENKILGLIVPNFIFYFWMWQVGLGPKTVTQSFTNYPIWFTTRDIRRDQSLNRLSLNHASISK